MRQKREAWSSRVRFSAMYSVDGVIGAPIRAGSVGTRDFGERLAGKGQLCHGHSVFEARTGGFVLQRLPSNGRYQDAIEMQPIYGKTGEGDVSAVRGVEAAAEERNSHACFDPRAKHRIAVPLASLCRVAAFSTPRTKTCSWDPGVAST